LKKYCLPYNTVIDAFFVSQPKYLFAPVIEFSGLPEGYRVIEVRENYERRGFDIVIEHSSFDIAPVGMPIPYDEASGFNPDIEIHLMKRVEIDGQFYWTYEPQLPVCKKTTAAEDDCEEMTFYPAKIDGQDCLVGLSPEEQSELDQQKTNS
jgi:hypothetical protein